MAVENIFSTAPPTISSSPTLSPTFAPTVIYQKCSSDTSGAMAFMQTYGWIYTVILFVQSFSCYMYYAAKNDPKFSKHRLPVKILLWLKNTLRKRKIFVLFLIHIWNQATDIGSLIEIYQLSQTGCSMGYTLLWRLFAICLTVIISYRVITASLALYATQKPTHFFYQMFDLLVIKDIELNYIFNSNNLDEIQTVIMYSVNVVQTFPIMLCSFGIMVLTQDFTGHPLLFASFIFGLIMVLLSTTAHDRIIFKEQTAQSLRFHLKEITRTHTDTDWSFKSVLRGKCCLCNDIVHVGFIYRVLFRMLDFQLRIFTLEFLWVTVGGVYTAMFIVAEGLVLYFLGARKYDDYQLMTGLVGIVINYSSRQKKAFSKLFALYRVLSNFMLLLLAAVMIFFEFEVPISPSYEERQSDFWNVQTLYLYCWAICLIHPWLFYGVIRGGRLIDENTPAVNPRDPVILIKKGDFWTFLQLCVFGNHFAFGNEWVLQGLLDGLDFDIDHISLQYWRLLLRACAWDWTKISYVAKARVFATILQYEDIPMIRFTFTQMKMDMPGVDAGILYWCQRAVMKGDYMIFFRTVKLIESHFEIRNFRPETQAALLKYALLRGLREGNIDTYKGVLHYRCSPDIMKYLYVHYTDFRDQDMNPELFAQMLHSIHSITQVKFIADDATAKCFLYWAVKLQLWNIISELLKDSHFSKQIHSRFHAKNISLLHLICSLAMESDEQMKNTSKIAHILIRRLFIRVNDESTDHETPLMFACRVLNEDLVRLLIAHGAVTTSQDYHGHTCLDYIEMYESREQRIAKYEANVAKAQHNAELLSLQSKNEFVLLNTAESEQKGELSDDDELLDIILEENANDNETEPPVEEEDEDGDGIPVPTEVEKPTPQTPSASTKMVSFASGGFSIGLREEKFNEMVQFPEDVPSAKQRIRDMIKAAQFRNEADDDFEDEFSRYLEEYQEDYDNFWSSKKMKYIAYSISKYIDSNSLFDAIRQADIKRIKDLLTKYNMDVNIPMIDGTTPLHYACEYSDAFVVKYLLDQNAYAFNAQRKKEYPHHLVLANKDVSSKEREIMQRLLALQDIHYNPFLTSDERVIEVERIQLFLRFFIRFFIILFAVFSLFFLASGFGADYFLIGYYEEYKGRIQDY